MNYSDLITQVASGIVVDTTNAFFVTAFPNWVAMAENRIYRDLNLLDAFIRDGSASTVNGIRNFNLPTAIGTFLIVQDLSVITPANTSPEAGTRNKLIPTSVAALDIWYPSNVASGPPQYWAYASQNTYLTGGGAQSQIVLGPWPDNTYRIEVYGQIQPAAISASNLSSWLTDNLWDVMFAATMWAATSWQQNFNQSGGTGGGADNPQMAATWDSTYKTLIASATTIAARARLAGPSWTGVPVEPIAQPQRG